MIARPLAAMLARGLAVGGIGSGGGDGGGDAFAVLDWYPALGSFASLRGPTPVFSRATGATMIDVAGNVVWGPENLSPWSEDLSNVSWAKRGTASVISNSILAPDGTMTGDQLTVGVRGANDMYNLTSLPTGAGAIVSFWMKKISGTGIVHVVNSAFVNAGQYFVDLSLVGSDWERIQPGHPAVTVVIPFTGASDQVGLNIGMGAATTGVFGMWGIQIERGSSARAYIPTAANPVFGPRITYDPVTHECLGYLAEEARTNQILQSGSMTVAPWASYLGVVATPNYAPSPILGEMATLIAFAATPDCKQYQNVSGWLPDVTISCWVKRESGTGKVRLETYDGTARRSADFTVDATWQRISFTANLGAPGNTSFLNGSDGLAHSVLVAGFQLEVGPFPTSYIPTTTAAVTRAQDFCSIGGADFASFYNQAEGTVVAKAANNVANDYHSIPAYINDGGFNTNFIQAGISTLSGEALRVYTGVASAIQGSLINGTLATGAMGNIAVAYKLDDFAGSFNGGPVQVDNTSLVPVVNRMDLDYLALSVITARVQYFPRRLPNAALVKLSTPGPDQDAQTYINAITESRGQEPTQVQQDAIHTFVNKEKAAGRWIRHRRIYLPIWENPVTNGIDMKSGAVRGSFIAGTIQAPGYVQGNGTSHYMQDTVGPSGLGLTPTSGYIWALIQQADSRSDARSFLGARTDVSGSGEVHLYQTNVSQVNSIIGRGGNTEIAYMTPTPRNGLYFSNRNAAGISLARRVTAGITRGAVAGAGTDVITSRPFFYMAMNDSTGATLFTDAKLGAFGVGLGLADDASVDAFTLNLKTLWETCTGLTLP